ncbi:hypothetical protein [Occultella kanbiaonis]|nr:hypothetical protein [Occultella kanbiaonis]
MRAEPAETFERAQTDTLWAADVFQLRLGQVNREVDVEAYP